MRSSFPLDRFGGIIQELRPQRVTIQFEPGDPLECRGVAGGVGWGAHRDRLCAVSISKVDDRPPPFEGRLALLGAHLAPRICAKLLVLFRSGICGSIIVALVGVTAPAWAAEDGAPPAPPKVPAQPTSPAGDA